MALAFPAKVVFALMLGLSSTSAADAPQTLFLSAFSFFDTSGEPRDQSAEHAERLAKMKRDLGGELEHKGLYKVVTASKSESLCETSETECILKQARNAGANIVLTAAVQKVSAMASSLWVGAFDTSDGKRVFFRQLTFRGDTDESWQHATAFLSRVIEDDPPKVR